MKAIFVMTLALSAWTSALSGEVEGDWRDELLEEERIGLSKEALENALKGEVNPVPELEKLFVQLGADEFSSRDEAQKELLKGGEVTMKWLQNHEPSSNPEVKRRVTEILGMLGTVHRKVREMAVEHAVTSLLVEGESRTKNTGGFFYEWFGEKNGKVGGQYRYFELENSVKRGAKVEEGKLVFSGEGIKNGDQRLVLHSKDWPGQKSFGESFQVSAKLGGELKGVAAWHLGISIGKVRALYHPGMDGSSFRFEKFDENKYLSRNESIGFMPGSEALQWMSVKVRRLEGGKVRLDVTLEEGGKGEGRFQSSITVDAEDIGDLDQVSLDRSGRTGGEATFADFTVRIADWE